MIDAISQAVAQAFIKSATIMGNKVHNALVKTFTEGTFPGCVGPCYMQPNQMQYTPLEISIAAALSAPNSQVGTSNSRHHHKLLLQRRQLQQILTTQLLYQLSHLCKMGLHLCFQTDGILPLSMACLLISSLHRPRCSQMHRLLSR